MKRMERFESNKFIADKTLPVFTCELANLYNVYKNDTSFDRYKHSEMVGKKIIKKTDK